MMQKDRRGSTSGMGHAFSSSVILVKYSVLTEK